MGWTDLNSSYIEWVLREHVELLVYVDGTRYDPATDILVISRPENYNTDNLLEFLDQGFKLLIVNLWEARPFVLAKDFVDYLDNILVILGCKQPFKYGWKNILSVPNWFWYNESLWYTCDKNFQYQNYIPKRTNKKLFFMPINRTKEFRDRIIERLGEFLDNSIYSYAQKFNNGIHLKTRDINPVAKLAWDRQFEEEWYNDTYFSVVVETACGQSDPKNEGEGILSNDKVPCELFVTEKTFKPIAHQHPFLICGMKNTLSYVKNIGFETYDHIFDESYDQLDFFDDRLEKVYNNIRNFNTSKYLDPLTEQKIRHNYNRFYDRSAVLAGVNQDLIEPMLEWIHAT